MIYKKSIVIIFKCDQNKISIEKKNKTVITWPSILKIDPIFLIENVKSTVTI
jgi:hypothetical protein